jgi:hypothetical protein
VTENALLMVEVQPGCGGVSGKNLQVGNLMTATKESNDTCRLGFLGTVLSITSRVALLLEPFFF